MYAVRKAFWFLWSKFNKLHFLCFILVLFFISRLNKIIWNKGGEGGKRIESIIAWVTEVAEHIYCNPHWSWLINGDGGRWLLTALFVITISLSLCMWSWKILLVFIYFCVHTYNVYIYLFNFTAMLHLFPVSIKTSYCYSYIHIWFWG